jgi:uncharacterized protein YutE (UPF0331/DUF86 family)
MTIDELKEQCRVEFSNIDKIMDELHSVYKSDKVDYTVTELAAMAALLINVYGGIEAILKQMLKFDKLDVDDSPDWHEKVLRKAGEIAILPPELIQLLSGYLAFRNFFLYNYIFNINRDEMKAMVEAVRDVVSKVHAEIDEYMQSF